MGRFDSWMASSSQTTGLFRSSLGSVQSSLLDFWLEIRCIPCTKKKKKNGNGNGGGGGGSLLPLSASHSFKGGVLFRTFPFRAASRGPVVQQKY